LGEIHKCGGAKPINEIITPLNNLNNGSTTKTNNKSPIYIRFHPKKITLYHTNK